MTTKSEDVNATLAERGARYGSFMEHARVAQGLKNVLLWGPTYEQTTPDQREALEMICHKIGRIVCGDPNYDDSWRDIAGYAMLVCNRLNSSGPQ
jgi:hypothetical protein